LLTCMKRWKHLIIYGDAVTGHKTSQEGPRYMDPKDGCTHGTKAGPDRRGCRDVILDGIVQGRNNLIFKSAQKSILTLVTCHGLGSCWHKPLMLPMHSRSRDNTAIIFIYPSSNLVPQTKLDRISGCYWHQIVFEITRPRNFTEAK
jgi:hypothetical protein